MKNYPAFSTKYMHIPLSVSEVSLAAFCWLNDGQWMLNLFLCNNLQHKNYKREYLYISFLASHLLLFVGCMLYNF